MNIDRFGTTEYLHYYLKCRQVWLNNYSPITKYSKKCACSEMNQITKKINQKKLRKNEHNFKKFWTFSKDFFGCFLRSFFLCDKRSLLDGDSYKAQECPRSFLLWRKFLSQIFGILYLGDKSLCLFYYVWSTQSCLK